MATLLELKQKYGEALDAMEKGASLPETEYEPLKRAADDIETQIKRMEELERKRGLAAKPVDVHPENKATVPATAKKDGEEPSKLSRSILALAANRGFGRLAAQWAEEKWGEEGSQVAKALATSVGPSGGFLVPEDFVNELIPLLRARSIVLQAGPRRLDMPNGNLTIPGMATGVSAAYLGENQNIRKDEQTFRQVLLNAKKIGVLVPISNDMIRYPTLSAEAFVKEDMAMAMGTKQDQVMLRGPGTLYEPTGLRQYASDNGATTFFSANTTVNVANIEADLAKAELALDNANMPEVRRVWMMSPLTRSYLATLRDENGNYVFPEIRSQPYQLKGRAVFTTTNIPDNIGGTGVGSEVYLVEMSQFIFGEAWGLELSVSQEAAYFDGSAVQSAFSRDQTVIRALAAHDTGLRYANAVVVINDARWYNA